MPEIGIDIKSIMPWEPSVRVAEKFQHGRIFLAGDAAHQMPPWGGQGANSGITDAHNLAWKLAAVMKGQAGETLLETYDAERGPVGREAAEASAFGVNSRGLITLKKNLTVARGMLRKAALVSGHGYGYTSKAICEENTFPLGGITWIPWTVPSLWSIDGRPGRRTPHVWIEREGKRVSTLDLLGKGFVLLAGAGGTSWLDAAEKVSSALGVEITAYRVGPDADLVAPKGEFEAAACIAPTGAILVRPDDFVVWRERRLPPDPRANLKCAMRQALCLR